jgi:hypothetical protein
MGYPAAAAVCVASLVVLSWTYPSALALLEAGSHSVAGLAAMAALGWSVLCAAVIRAVHAGVSSS